LLGVETIVKGLGIKQGCNCKEKKPRVISFAMDSHTQAQIPLLSSEIRSQRLSKNQLICLAAFIYECILKISFWGTWLAWSMEHAALDLVSVSAMLGVEIT